MTKRLFAALLLLVVPAAALADQAEHLTRVQADKAVALLGTQKQIKHYCPTCEDKGIYPDPLEKLFASPSGRKDAWHVFIRDEGDALDLAYVYFKDKTGRWKNVALHLGMKVEGVPLFLPGAKTNEGPTLKFNLRTDVTGKRISRFTDYARLLTRAAPASLWTACDLFRHNQRVEREHLVA